MLRIQMKLLSESLADAADVVTYEFENVPVEATRVLEEKVTLHPRPEILHICQNREREKNFLRDNGIPRSIRYRRFP